MPHSRSWLLVPNPSSQQHQRPPESPHEPPWLFNKDHLPLLLVSVCKCNYPKTYIYIYIYLVIFPRCLGAGFARGLPVRCRQRLEMGNRHSAIPARRAGRQAGRDRAEHHCLCLRLASAGSTKAARQQPRSRRGFLQGAAAPRDALKGRNLKTGAVTENCDYGIY